MNVEKEYYSNGNVAIEEHYNDKNDFHREDGPATIWYYENGNIEREEYFINGKYHRENGPASIWYNINGKIIQEEYWIDDKEYKDLLQYMIAIEIYKENKL